VLQGRAQRQEEALASEGTWATTAQQVSAAQGSPSPFSRLPPAFAALYQNSVPNCTGLRPGQFGTGSWSVHV
jgi:hypothetical protein